MLNKSVPHIVYEISYMFYYIYYFYYASDTLFQWCMMAGWCSMALSTQIGYSVPHPPRTLTGDW